MTRNTSHLKKVQIQIENTEVSDSDEEPDTERGVDAEQMVNPPPHSDLNVIADPLTTCRIISHSKCEPELTQL